MVEFTTNVLYICDSIPDGELNTARQLRDDLEAIASSETSNGRNTFRVELKKLSSRDALLKFLDCVAISDGVSPILHFECHGNESGLEFADKSTASWKDLKPYLQKINEACKCNLFVTLASCNGANLISLIQPTERSPFCGFIGVIDEMSVDNAQKSYKAFYSKLVRQETRSQALSSLLELNRTASSPRYCFRSAEDFFKSVYAGYLTEHCNETALWRRAKRIRELPLPDAKKTVSIQDISIRLKSEATYGFIQVKSYFFYEDLFPENAKRFKVTLDQIDSAKPVARVGRNLIAPQRQHREAI